MDTLANAAVKYAEAGLAVFPLSGKIPLFRQCHPKGTPERESCRGACGRDGHGVFDATTDIDRVTRWWRTHPDANIGARVPAGAAVVDIDPRHGGHHTIADLEWAYAPLEKTLRVYSGRGDGGHHLWFRHPGGRLTSSRELPGIDIKVHPSYVLMPPSLHPDTGRPYYFEDPDVPMAPMTGWFAALLRPARPAQPPQPSTTRLRVADDDSIADWFTATTTWPEILSPHGWAALDTPATRWLHPAATSELSATIRHECIFVYSTSTPFDPTTPDAPRGYTRFRAWATLNHGGDLRAAARAARQLRNEQERRAS